MAKDYAKKFYRSARWEKARQLALIRDGGLCCVCGKPAEEVHHVVHLTEQNITDAEIALGQDNLRCLCRDCHFKQHDEDRAKGKTKRDDTGNSYCFDANGYLVRINSPPDV